MQAYIVSGSTIEVARELAPINRLALSAARIVVDPSSASESKKTG
jgi:hypothetical protein